MPPTIKQPTDYAEGELDKAYSARATVPDFEAAIRPYAEDSARVRERFDAQLDVPYGAGPDELLDIFPARQPSAPIQFFIHGGYWRMLTKDDSSFPAAAFVPAGATFICNSHSLAPEVTLDQIVLQNRAALAWVYENAATFGGDRDRIHVSGHSAGGQLVGMLLATDWGRDYGLPPDLIKGATTISGVFDLRPIRHSFVNEWLGLDDDGAERNSPILRVPEIGCPLIVSYAEHDTEAFHDQSQAFLAAWREDGHPGSYIPMPGHTHFSVVLELSRPESPLTRAIFEQMSL